MKKYIYDVDLKAQIAIESILDHIKTLEDVERIIDNMPPAPVEEIRPKGKWLKDGDFFICLNCESEINEKNSLGEKNKRNYCPCCGAKME